MQHSLSPPLSASYSSASSSLRKLSLPRSSQSSVDSNVRKKKKKKKKLRTRSRWKKWTRSQQSGEAPPLLARVSSSMRNGREGGGGGGRGGDGERSAPYTVALCVHSPDDTVREASCRPLFDPRTLSTRLVCVCDDPTGPVFWPRLTRALGACSPRSHPSGHALFHPGERIVRLGLAAHSPRAIGVAGALRRGTSSTSRGRSLERSTVVDVPRGCTQGGRYVIRERTEVRQDLIGTGAGDCLGSGRTVAPRNAKRRKPACWNARVVTPTRASATPSIHGHEDTDRTTPTRDGSLYQVSEISVTSTGWSERRVVLLRSKMRSLNW